MNDLLKYDDFINEKKWLKTAVAIAAMAGMAGYSYHYYQQHKGQAELQDKEIVGETAFNEYSLITKWGMIKLNAKDGIIVSEHSYTEGSGDDETTIYRTNLIIPDGVDVVYYKNKAFKGTYASSEYFQGSTRLELSDLKLYKKYNTYSIYTMKKWFGVFDYIIITKNHKEGEEFKFMDKVGITYTVDQHNEDIFIICSTGYGKGDFGGGGSGSEF